ncbi:MAG: hypothetical protein K0S08_256 [Gammaproteobacteria bacterium]|jgi:hypothetical protein|nr:hypothetical protein [Gammaproteobacteria bacterium]
MGAILVLYPTWNGLSFFDYKDIPSAFFYTLFTYTTCLLLAKINEKNNFVYKIFFIFSAALFCGTKMAFILATIPNIALVICAQRNIQGVRTAILLMIGIVCVSILFTPAAWFQPIYYIIHDIKVMGDHAKFNPGCGKIWGSCISPLSSEWSAGKYLFKWYISQTPIALLVFFAFGMLTSIKALCCSQANFKQSFLSQIKLLPVIFQCAVIPFGAILKNSAFNDGIRHTIFIVPMIIIIAGIGIHSLLKYKNLFLSRTIILFLSLTFIGLTIDNLALEPYQYSYFNEIARFFITNKNADNDYWAFSLREAFNLIPKTNSITYIHAWPDYLVTPYADKSKFTFITLDQAKTVKHFYALSTSRFKYLDDHVLKKFHCTPFGEIQRRLFLSPENMVMSKVYYCDGY